MKASRRLWTGLVVLILLSPAGLLLPAAFGSGSAWGEWSTAEVRELAGYIPGGMERLSDLWKAPMPDYSAPGRGSAPLRELSFWYIVSGLLGAGAVAGITMLLGRLLAGGKNAS